MDKKNIENKEPEKRDSVSIDDIHSLEDTNFERLRQKEKLLVRKLDLRIIPWLSLLYLFSFLDRGNIGNARLAGLEESLEMSGDDFEHVLLIFYAGYILFQIPSNIMVKIATPSRWISGTMVIWGFCVLGMGFTRSFAGLEAARFFLGCFESGVGPGSPLLLSFWYLREEMAMRVALFFGSSTLAGAFSGAIAYAIMNHLNGAGGFEAWRWIFIIEAIPTILLGLASFLMLPDYPERASTRWLTPEEKKLAIDRAKRSHSIDEKSFDIKQLVAALLDYRNWLLGIIYIGLNVALSSYTAYLPTIVGGLGYTNLDAQLLTVPAYLIACVVVIIVAWNGDRTKQRGLHIAFVSSIGIIGYIMLLVANDNKIRYAGSVIIASGIYPIIPTTLAWISNNNKGHTKRAVALAFINMMGQAFSIFGATLYKKSEGPLYIRGHTICVCFLFVSGVTALILRFLLKRENARRDEYQAALGNAQVTGSNTEGDEDLYDRHPGFRNENKEFSCYRCRSGSNNASDDAPCNELDCLRQNTSIGKYVEEFERIADGIPDLSEKEKIDLFIKGLKPRIQTEVKLRHPKSLMIAMYTAKLYNRIVSDTDSDEPDEPNPLPYFAGTLNSNNIIVFVGTGLGSNFISKHIVDAYQLETSTIDPVTLDFGLGGTGICTQYAKDVPIKIGNYQEKLNFYVADIGPGDVFLGTPWFILRNPSLTIESDHKIDFKFQGQNIHWQCMRQPKRDFEMLFHITVRKPGRS
ncbi:uncharacterized protein VTP21DRAFT_8935 [Calcarisporiella thermophila]|uniref:uncharacterized protein n=1 Tax=Calcarisporiella thermophila TaxID=911321 RepID=UPI0037449C91